MPPTAEASKPKKLAKTHVSVTEVARELGVSPNTARRRLIAAGAKPTRVEKYRTAPLYFSRKDAAKAIKERKAKPSKSSE